MGESIREGARVERLNALDAAFLELDTANAPFVVGGILELDGRPWRGRGGSLDRDALRGAVARAIAALPRCSQRIARTPLIGGRVWVSDRGSDIARHCLFATLPAPGTARELHHLAGAVLSRDLDLSHAPWEITFVDGLAGGRVAMIAKLHHAMADGVIGMRLLDALTGVGSGGSPPAPRRSSPGLVEIVRAELAHRRRVAGKLLGRDGARQRSSLQDSGELARLLGRALRPASDAGLNPHRIGRGRRFASFELDLGAVAAAGHAVGATINDVTLAIASVGLRRFLQRRGVPVDRLDDFRAMVPVSTHGPGEDALAGNRVALRLVRLPVDEHDERRTLLAVRDQCAAARRAPGDVRGGELLVALGDLVSPKLLAGVIRAGLWMRAFNVIVTNVPGPTSPIDIFGARLERLTVAVNLWPGQTIGLAVASYAGRLGFGISADRDAVPDLESLRDDLAAAASRLTRDLQSSRGGHSESALPM